MRTGRVVLGGFLGELILILAVIPVRMATTGDTAITVVAVAGSFVVFVPVAWALCRSIERPILHGALMGAAGAAIYILLTIVGKVFAPDAPPVPLIYYLAHVLKIAGGTGGGWLATRSRAAQNVSVKVS